MNFYNNLSDNLKNYFVLNSIKIKQILKKILLILLGVLMMILAAWSISKISKIIMNKKPNVEFGVPENKAGVDAALINYKDEVLKYSEKYELPPEYFLALIMLESSGRSKIKPRFEKWVFNQLKDLRSSKIERFENLTPETLKSADNAALKNLASSWGPCQIMGYKCISLNINVLDLRGEDRVKWALTWINNDYGKYLREGKYKDAFHIHNTGQAYPKSGKPKTYDPDYVKNGLEYMKVFKEKLKDEN